MDYRPKLVILCFLLSSKSVFAGYALPSPPPYWSSVGTSVGGTPGQFGIRLAANDSVMNGVARMAAGATVNVGGRAVVMPVAFRVAANAGAVAARASFGNPALFVGVLAASALYQYYKTFGLTVDALTNKWKHIEEIDSCTSGCYEYRINVDSIDSGWNHSKMGAASIWFAAKQAATPAQYTLSNMRVDGTKIYWDVYQGGVKIQNGANRDITQRDIPPYKNESIRDAQLSDFPIPEAAPVPEKLPDPIIRDWPSVFPPLPVGDPVLNPTPEPSLDPQPMRVPFGDPILVPAPNPNPDNLPNRWKTPVIDIVPSPVPESPWRVDVQPKDIYKNDPSPLPPQSPVTQPSTPPTSANPDEKPVEPDLCEKHPEIIACQVFQPDDVSPEPLKNVTRDLSISPDLGWGPENGSCPAPKTATIHGLNISMPFTMLCDFAILVRPLFIGFAWFSAALLFIGMGRKD